MRAVVLAVFLLAATLTAACFWLLADLPDPRDLRRAHMAEPTRIYDRRGRLLYEWLEPLEGKHIFVPLERIPRALREATIATEDASFYENPGVDFWAILRAAYLNLRHGRIVSGGSTITQQVARTLLLAPEERWQRTWMRKLREAVLAWRIARAYTKDEILELYLNYSYYGNLAYGVGAAAEAYFAKRVDELDLAECALLAGLPQAPALYNPLTNPTAAKERQATVLALMVKVGFISEEEATRAGHEELRYASSPFSIQAPHFVMYVRQELEEMYGLETVAQGGWRVTTTLDLDMQARAESAIRRHLAALNDPSRDGLDHNVHNAALVALDPANGEVLVMVGSPDYFDLEIAGAVNGALALRQPGSSIKPLTYAAALSAGNRVSAGYTPASVILDVRKAYLTAEGDSYVPVNYDRRYHGPISLRRALATSSNAAAVSVLNDIGVDALIEMAHRLGVTWSGDLGRFGLALTLGGGEVCLLDLTTAFACFAAAGQRVEPVLIQRIEDAHGQLVYTNAPRLQELVLDPRVAYLITDILADDNARAPAFGEGSMLYIGRPAAVKTGTTEDWRDNWTVGYTPDLVVGVWVGNADNEPMKDVSGIAGAAPIWHDFMVEMHKNKPVKPFTEPPGVVQVEICADSGLLPNPHCPHRRLEKFLAGSEPTALCQAHQLYRIDIATGLLATAETPSGRIREQVYFLLPPEAQAWGWESGFPQPPTDSAPLSEQTPLQRIEIISPDPNAHYAISHAIPPEAQRIEIAARWNGTGKPRHVTILLNGEPLAWLEESPYRLLWTLVPGDYEVLARAVDADGHTWTSAPLRFRVDLPR